MIAIAGNDRVCLLSARRPRQSDLEEGDRTVPPVGTPKHTPQIALKI